MTDADGARGQAREILSERRFQDPDLPQPLKGPLQDLGDLLEDIAQPFQDLFEAIADGVPGGEPVVGLLLGLLVLVLAGLTALHYARRREARVVQAVAVAAGERVSAADLRRAAEAAERAGDLEEAVRLRFRAGLLELGERDLLDLRPALPNAELRTLGSPTLDGLTDAFEQVAYGGRAAGAEDVEEAREGWPRVVDEVVESSLRDDSIGSSLRELPGAVR